MHLRFSRFLSCLLLLVILIPIYTPSQAIAASCDVATITTAQQKATDSHAVVVGKLNATPSEFLRTIGQDGTNSFSNWWLILGNAVNFPGTKTALIDYLLGKKTNAEDAMNNIERTAIEAYKTTLIDQTRAGCDKSVYDANRIQLNKIIDDFNAIISTKLQDKLTGVAGQVYGYILNDDRLKQGEALIFQVEPISKLDLEFGQISSQSTVNCEKLFIQTSTDIGGARQAISIAATAYQNRNAQNAANSSAETSLDVARNAFINAGEKIAELKNQNCDPTRIEALENELTTLQTRLNEVETGLAKDKTELSSILASKIDSTITAIEGLTCKKCDSKAEGNTTISTLIGPMIRGLCCLMYEMLQTMIDFLKQVTAVILDGLDYL